MMLPDTMHAVLLTGHGGLDRLNYRDDVPVPRPAAGEVLIRVGASAGNNTDVTIRTGWYSKSVRGDTITAASTGYDGRRTQMVAGPVHCLFRAFKGSTLADGSGRGRQRGPGAPWRAYPRAAHVSPRRQFRPICA